MSTAPSPTPGAIGAFAVDLLIAGVAMLVLGLAGGVGWAILEGVMVGLDAGNAGGPEAIAARIGSPGPMALLALTVISTGGAALVVYAWRRRATATERLQSRQAALRGKTWFWVVVAGGGCFLWSSGVGWLAESFGTRPDPSNLALVELAMQASPWALVVFAVVLAPMYEELLFRRVLFGRLLQAGRPVLGLVLSSAAFALLHEVPGMGANPLSVTAVLWLVYAGMGAAFALLYWRTGTLWAPVAAHALNNALALGLLA